MADPEDAPPTRGGQAVVPKQVVAGGIGPDGNFFLDVPDDEMVGRGLMNLLMHELDRYYTNKRMAKMMEQAQQTRVLDGMMGTEKRTIDKKLKGLR